MDKMTEQQQHTDVVMFLQRLSFAPSKLSFLLILQNMHYI